MRSLGTRLLLILSLSCAGPAWAGGARATSPEAPPADSGGLVSTRITDPMDSPRSPEGALAGGPIEATGGASLERGPAGPELESPSATPTTTTDGQDLDAFPGMYDLTGQRDDLRADVRLVIRALPGGAGFEVVRRAVDPRTGELQTLAGRGTVRQGLLLVEFVRCVASSEAGPLASLPPVVSGAASSSSPATPVRLGGISGALSALEPEAAVEVQPAPALAHEPLAVEGSVGRDAVNRPEDVRRIQDALVTLGYLQPGAFAAGRADATTIAGIERYQRERAGFQWPDGRVDVDNRTLRALNREAALRPDPVLTPSVAAPEETPRIAASAPRPVPSDLAPERLDALAGAMGTDDSGAIVGAYKVREGRILGATRDHAYAPEGGDPAWGVERGWRVGD